VVTSSTATLVTRDAIPRDAYALTRVLTAALAASPLGGWLEPDPRRRPHSALDCIGPLVPQSIRAGIVRLAEQDGVIVAAALWSLHPCAGPVAASMEALREVSRRRDRLDRFTEKHRPPLRHQQLVYLGVHPKHRGQGIGAHLLTDHHALLNATGTPAYAVVADKATRDMLARHGYTPTGRAEPLRGGARARAMWRPPDLAASQENAQHEEQEHLAAARSPKRAAGTQRRPRTGRRADPPGWGDRPC